MQDYIHEYVDHTLTRQLTNLVQDDSGSLTCSLKKGRLSLALSL